MRIARNHRRTSRVAAALVRPAFTLLEVILALSILAGSVAVLGELFRFGLRNADAARQLTRAEMLCESIADQVDIGALPATGVSNTPCDDDPRFLYSINVNQANQTGLLTIEVLVQRDLPEAQHPQKFSLTRWIIDPGVQQQQMSSEQQTATDQAAAANGATGAGTPAAGGGS
jgi:prepilin-type N-terminal cleavage/methylation domain-containing protein